MRTAWQNRGPFPARPSESCPWAGQPHCGPDLRWATLVGRGCAASLLQTCTELHDAPSTDRPGRSKQGFRRFPVRQCPPVLTFICLFMVIQKSMMKYTTRMGQNTGTLKASKKVQAMATRMPLVAACLKAGEVVSVAWGHGSTPPGAVLAVCSYRAHHMQPDTAFPRPLESPRCASKITEHETFSEEAAKASPGALGLPPGLAHLPHLGCASLTRPSWHPSQATPSSSGLAHWTPSHTGNAPGCSLSRRTKASFPGDLQGRLACFLLAPPAAPAADALHSQPADLADLQSTCHTPHTAPGMQSRGAAACSPRFFAPANT